MWVCTLNELNINTKLIEEPQSTIEQQLPKNSRELT